jgi:hypothetical protein
MTKTLLCTTMAAGLLGCNPEEAPRPLDARAVDQTPARAADVVRQTGAGISFLGSDDGVLQKLFSGADEATGGLMGKATPPPLPAPLMRQLRTTPALKAMGIAPIQSFLTAEEQFDETARDVEVLLRDRLLVKSNEESRSDTEVVYLLKADPTCLPLPSSAETSPDPDCVADLPRLQVRLVVRADGDGVRITVQVGPARHELSAFIVHSDLLGWEVEYARALQALDFVDTTLEPGQPSKMYPFSKLEGRQKVAIQKLGPKKVKAWFGVLQPIVVEVNDPDSDPVSFRTAASDPMFALTADGAAKEAIIAVAVGQTDVKTRWDQRGTGARNTDLHVSVGGYYGEATLTESKKELVLRGLGVGQTFVAVRGAHIFDLDFNPASGRKMDVKVLVTADDRPRFEISPKFDLSLKFNFGAVAADFDEPPPAFLTNATYTVRLDGATPAVIEAAPQTPTFDGGLKIVAGTLTLATDSAPATSVSVPAGKCLTGRDAPAGSHEVLGALEVVDCL